MQDIRALITAILLLVAACIASGQSQLPPALRGSDGRSADADAPAEAWSQADWTPASSLEAEGVASENLSLSDLEEILGGDLRQRTEQHINELEEQLRPMLTTIPKNQYGKWGHTAVRYALHRLFVKRHGWFLRGLDPAGKSFNASSPLQGLEGRVQGRARAFFERRLGGRGLSLRDVAVFGGVLENLIHLEATAQMKAVYDHLGLKRDTALDERSLDNVLDIYFSSFLMGTDISKMSKEELVQQKADMKEAYTDWVPTQQFLREARAKKLANRGKLGLTDAVAVVEEVSEKFGRRQNKDCLNMKQRLVNLEAGTPGCVPLSHFYDGMLTKGQWEFSESPAYLRWLGALDESDPRNPQVILPNYLDGPSSCLASTSDFSVCCISECEDIFSDIEQRVHAPDAEPEALWAAMAAQRATPAAHKEELVSIAERHGGRVPLHSRLFLQWLHFAFPRECSYPHVSGTTQLLSPEVFTQKTGKDAMATMDEMKNITALAAGAPSRQPGVCGKWLDAQELLVPQSTRLPPQLRDLETDAHTWAAVASVALVALLSTMTVLLIHTLRSVRKQPVATPAAKPAAKPVTV